MKNNIEKELKDLQTLIDNVIDEDVSSFTSDFFSELENIINDDISSIEQDVIEEYLYETENILNIINPALKLEVEFFKKLEAILKNILN